MLSLDVLEGSLRSWRFYWRDGKIRERLSRERAGAIGVFLVAAHFVKLCLARTILPATQANQKAEKHLLPVFGTNRFLLILAHMCYFVLVSFLMPDSQCQFVVSFAEQ